MIEPNLQTNGLDRYLQSIPQQQQNAHLLIRPWDIRETIIKWRSQMKWIDSNPVSFSSFLPISSFFCHPHFDVPKHSGGFLGTFLSHCCHSKQPWWNLHLSYILCLSYFISYTKIKRKLTWPTNAKTVEMIGSLPMQWLQALHAGSCLFLKLRHKHYVKNNLQLINICPVV